MFITTNGVFQPQAANLSDAFVTRLNPSGTQWRYSSYRGGNYGDHAGRDIGGDDAEHRDAVASP